MNFSEFFYCFLHRKTQKIYKKHSVSMIASLFVKKFHLQTFVTSFFSCALVRRKSACEPFWNFLRPLATQNFKLRFFRKCSFQSWTGVKRSLTVGKIFFNQKRDIYTNKVQLIDWNDIFDRESWQRSYKLLSLTLTLILTWNKPFSHVECTFTFHLTSLNSI